MDVHRRRAEQARYVKIASVSCEAWHTEQVSSREFFAQHMVDLPEAQYERLLAGKGGLWEDNGRVYLCVRKED